MPFSVPFCPDVVTKWGYFEMKLHAKMGHFASIFISFRTDLDAISSNCKHQSHTKLSHFALFYVSIGTDLDTNSSHFELHPSYL